jgi:hypothetical protein
MTRWGHKFDSCIAHKPCSQQANYFWTKALFYASFYNPAISKRSGFADASIVILLPASGAMAQYRKKMWSMVFGLQLLLKNMGLLE